MRFNIGESASFIGTAGLLLSLLLLGGCAALVVGGGASGSYPATSAAAEQRAADQRISSAIRSELQADRILAGAEISVSTDGGVVTLEGVVVSYAARSQAETLAAGVRGVRVVDNRLKIKGGL